MILTVKWDIKEGQDKVQRKINMTSKDKLEEYLTVGVYGAPEIKKEEKIRYLGLFRENVVKGLTFQEIQDAAGVFYFKLALKEPHVDKVVIRQDILEEKRRQLIAITTEKNLDFKVVSSEDFIGDLAVVLASNKAVNSKDISMENKPEISQFFKGNFGKSLCKDCLEKAEAIHPDLPKEFKKISFFDKIMGIKCECDRGQK